MHEWKTISFLVFYQYRPFMDMPTVINTNSIINGDVLLSTDIRIDGKVYGKVETDKNIIIGENAFVKGFLRANNLVIFGRIEGNVITTGLTSLHANSSIFGNLYTRLLEVKEGANITARIITYDKLNAQDEAAIYIAEEMIAFQSKKIGAPPLKKSGVIDNLVNTENAPQNPDPSTDESSEKTVTDPAQIFSVEVDKPIKRVVGKSTIKPNRDASEKKIHHEFTKPAHLNGIRYTEAKPLQEPEIIADGNHIEKPSEAVVVTPSFACDLEVVAATLQTDESPVEQLEVIKPEADLPISSKTNGKSILFASLMEQPVANNLSYVDSSDVRNKPDESGAHNPEGKTKARPGFGFEELKSLLVSKKMPDSKPNEGEQIKGHTDHQHNGKTENKADKDKDEKSGRFLSQAIQQLPPTDHSLLFK